MSKVAVVMGVVIIALLIGILSTVVDSKPKEACNKACQDQREHDLIICVLAGDGDQYCHEKYGY